MRDKPITRILRVAAPVAITDSLGRASEAMRVAGVSELPVLEDGRLVGVIREADVFSEIVRRGGAQEAALASIGPLVFREAVLGGSRMSVVQAAEVMDSRSLQSLPIVDEFGRYMGVVTRSDLVGALAGSIRPPSVGGLATPLGVYLTTGHIRAGAGDFGLFLAGASLMVLNYVGLLIIVGLALFVEKALGFPLWTALRTPWAINAEWVDPARSVLLGLSAPIFLLLLRLSPLSGYHAAEHQVVHAIERGEPLTPEVVKTMPRVHPRCGTNIVAAVVVFFMVSEAVSSEVAAMIAVFILVFSWRTIGAYFQQYVTTRPPSLKQLQSGIRAGEGILREYRDNPASHVAGLRRLWNTGMPQVMIGAAFAFGLGEQVLRIVAPELM
ncbi:MAG: DUF1385 domain-containing protein [Armatimonadetes bacterium]|nr:DUF1385 domain-containing protein [Armatimonadota bacterium]